MDDAFKYVKSNGGLCSEKEYPYAGKDHIFCRKCDQKYAPISGYVDVKVKDSSALETAVAAGCVSVSIEADQTAFQSYSSGVMTGRFVVIFFFFFFLMIFKFFFFFKVVAPV